MVLQMLIAVCHHCSATIPAASSDDVHRRRGKRIRGPHHGPDVGVVREVLDGHMKRVSACIDVVDDRLTTPIPVCINDIPGVALGEQLRVVARIVG